MKSTAHVFFVLALCPGFAAAQVLPPTDGYTVEVSFSKGLERRMASINNLEQTFEERFRENRHDGHTFAETGTQRYAKSKTTGTEWAGTRLIGDLSDFTLENLVQALVAYNVNRAVPDFRGRIEIDISRLKLTNPSIAFLEWSRSYARGHVRVTGADGRVLFDDEVTANLVIDTTVNRSHDGPELAFVEIDPSRRVGPTLAQFVERALEQVWPASKNDIVGPVIVRVSEVNERLIFN